MSIQPPSGPLNRSLTDCIVQLADRASEIGERHTAVVLYSLAGHREVAVDSLLAISAAEHAALVKLALDMGYLPGMTSSLSAPPGLFDPLDKMFDSPPSSSKEEQQDFPF